MQRPLKQYSSAWESNAIFFAFLTFTGLVCLGSPFVSEFLATFEIFQFFFVFVMSISLGNPVGVSLFTDALRSCPQSTWYGAFGAVIATFIVLQCTKREDLPDLQPKTKGKANTKHEATAQKTTTHYILLRSSNV